MYLESIPSSYSKGWFWVQAVAFNPLYYIELVTVTRLLMQEKWKGNLGDFPLAPNLQRRGCNDGNAVEEILLHAPKAKAVPLKVQISPWSMRNNINSRHSLQSVAELLFS